MRKTKVQFKTTKDFWKYKKQKQLQPVQFIQLLINEALAGNLTAIETIIEIMGY